MAATFWNGGRLIVFGGVSRGPPNNYESTVPNGGVYDALQDVWMGMPGLNTNVNWPWFNNRRAVWGGDFLLVRGGYAGYQTALNTGVSVHSAGGYYSPESDNWLSRPVLNGGTVMPALSGQAAVWTGEWYLEHGGGVDDYSLRQDGRAYDPMSDTLLSRPVLQSSVGAPSPRGGAVYSWTGAHLMVWAGGAPIVGGNSQPMPGDGGLYDPVKDKWIDAPSLNGAINSPLPRAADVMVWTGDRLLFWGGQTSTGTSAPVLNTGGIYVAPRVAPTIRSGQVDAALQANTFFRHRVTVYGCPRATVGVMGMPSWMTQKWLDTGCFLEGTPNAAEALQTSTITITADNGIGTFAMQTIVVGPPAPAFIDQIPNLNAEVGPRFEYRIPAGGPPYPTLSATGMPAWMSIVSGRIEGYPTQADVNQVSTITVTAVNGVGVPASRTFTVTVIPPIPPGGTAPQFTTPAQLSTLAAVPFSMLLTATGTPTPVFSLQNPPVWLGLNGDILSGTPPASLSGQTINITLQASNNVPPAATATLALTILHHPTDITRDAAIDVVDVQRVVNLILTLGVEAYPGEGDANGDSVVDVVDVQAVVNKILAP